MYFSTNNTVVLIIEIFISVKNSLKNLVDLLVKNNCEILTF